MRHGARTVNAKLPLKNPSQMAATVLNGTEETSDKQVSEPPKKFNGTGKKKLQAYCPYCVSSEHFLSQCDTFKSFDKDQITQ